MAHDVFISHSSKDKPIADAVCAMLESQGVRCWIAPRDILPGMEWGAAIVEAIRGARLMVLIFSASANSSAQITREVERAVHNGIPVIPLRIEDVSPTASLEYFISAPHWLDAFTPPLEGHLKELVKAVQQILGMSAKANTVDAPSAPSAARVAASPEKQSPRPSRIEKAKGTSGLLLSLGTAALILLTLFAGWWFGIEQPRRKQSAVKNISSEAKGGTDALPRTLIVPDQHPTIQAAIDAAREGDTIRVKAGTYSESARLREGIRLMGEGKDLVKVRSTAANITLNCDGIKNGFVSGMTFEHSDKSNNPGSRQAVVSLGDGCAVEITDCRIQLGDGSGLTVANGSPKITECILEKNGRNGIAVTGSKARPVIARNQCRGNEQDGILFLQAATGDVQGNICENNKRNGISAAGVGTAPALKSNQCRGNEEDGIQFGDGAAGEIRENVCENNKRSGISIYGKNTATKLISNISRNNANYGIWCQVGSSPQLSANQTSGNRAGQEIRDGGTPK